MSQAEEDDSKQWTENDLKEAVRRINAGEINVKEAENHYGISPRTIHRQRAIENMRAQLNPEKAKKLKPPPAVATRKDLTVLRKPVETSCSSITDIVSLLSTGTEEVKQLLNYECDLIYECKVCKNLFRSLVNFISHKRVYCCDMFSVIHTQSDEPDGGSITELDKEERLKSKENFKEFIARPFRVTCRKDITTVLKRITSLSSEYTSAEPILQLTTLENTPYADQQIMVTSEQPIDPSKLTVSDEPNEDSKEPFPLESISVALKTQEKPLVIMKTNICFPEKRFRCPLCPSQCTTKKSVLRHLKYVHHKTEEQLQKLKPRIQMIYIKKKEVSTDVSASQPSAAVSTSTFSLPSSSSQLTTNVSSSPRTSPLKDKVSPVSRCNSDLSSKREWEKNCSTCGRVFTNRNSYAVHVRICRTNTGSKSIVSNESISKRSLLPVVSLTPIRPTRSSVANVIAPAQKKKLISGSLPTKKISLPVTAVSCSSSESKKIGIQVRMNYCKEGVSQSNNIISAPIALHSPTFMSANNSRRNSFVSLSRDERPDIINGHNTRSSSKLAHILNKLLDKRNVKYENEDTQGTMDTKVEDLKTTVIDGISIYCKDCRKTYPLNEFKWFPIKGVTHNLKCAIRNCDFRSTEENKLWSHLRGHRTNGDLTGTRALFLVDACGQSEQCSVVAVKDEQKEKQPSKRIGVATVSSTGIKRKANSNLDIHSKRKNVEKKVIPRIRKTKHEKKIVSENVNSKPANKESKEMRPGSNPQTLKKLAKTTTASETGASRPATKEFKEVVPTNSSPTLKKHTKKVENVVRIVRVKKSTVDTSVMVQNGNEISVSEDEDKSHFSVNKLNSKPAKVEKSVISTDSKTSQRLTKTSRIQNDFSPASTPDSDLDATSMSEVLKIIFGKDISLEKMEGVQENHDKSLSLISCPSTSVETIKDKNHKHRFTKQVLTTVNKDSAVSDDREDKLSRIRLFNKTKSNST